MEPALPLIDESVVAFDAAVFDHSCSRLTCTAPLAMTCGRVLPSKVEGAHEFKHRGRTGAHRYIHFGGSGRRSDRVGGSLLCDLSCDPRKVFRRTARSRDVCFSSPGAIRGAKL